MSDSNSNTKLAEWIAIAQDAARAAYNPYSHFAVGCALISRSGQIYTGCNIENASFGVTLCAERVAAAQAILKGDRDWEAIVIVSPQRVSPCGICRQFLNEFSPAAQVWMGYLTGSDIIGPIAMSDLLPSAMILKPL